LGDKKGLLHSRVNTGELCVMEGRKIQLRCRPEWSTGSNDLAAYCLAFRVLRWRDAQSSTFHSRLMTFSDVLFYIYISKHIHC